MRKSHLTGALGYFLCAAFILGIAGVACRDSGSDELARIKGLIRAEVDAAKVINAHEHQRWPAEFEGNEYNFYTLLAYSYLKSDLVSAGGPQLTPEDVNLGDLDALWEKHGPYLDLCRNTSYYSHFLAGFRLLYDYCEPVFSRNGVAALSRQITDKYKQRDTWYAEAFREAGFELMFVDQYWNALNSKLDPRYFALVLNVNPLVSCISDRERLLMQEAPASGNVYKWAKERSLDINTLDDYLKTADLIFSQFLADKAVCLKNSMAYWRSLDYEDVPYSRARELYALPEAELSSSQKKALQDFMFHWIIRKSIEVKLPIQIHTGYLAGNGNRLDNGRPIKLNNLFLQYREARFVLFHGGYPWTGEYAALGKMFPNVYLDLVWLPQISREEAVRSLDEILDTVPYNKLFWGGDCHFIEESTGSLEFGRDVVAQVLAARMDRGLLTMETAVDIAAGIFRDNAIKVFSLKKLLEGR
jgi:hypothetical protein